MRKYPQQDPTLPQGFTITFRERFWSKVDKNGPFPTHQPALGQCWIWKGSANELGYGHIQKGKRGAGKIRAPWASKLLNEESIPLGQNALHKCDNAHCVNPDHIFFGSHADNVHDKINKGRQGWGVKVGEDHPNAKLSRESVEFIRRSELTGKQLGEVFGVNAATINRARYGKTWMSGYGGVVVLRGVSNGG